MIAKFFRLKEKKYSNINIIFIIIICILFININSIHDFFKAIDLLPGNNILFVTNNAIKIYNISTQTETLIKETDFSIPSDNLKLVSLTQFPLEKGGYIICRLNTDLYIFNKDVTFIRKDEISEIANADCIVKPYKTLSGETRIIFAYADISSNDLTISMYKINIEQTNDPPTLLKTIIKNPLNRNKQPISACNKKLSCELITVSNYTNELLVCFAVDQQNALISAITFYPENNLSFLYYSNNFKETGIIINIYSDLSPNNKIILICFLNNMFSLGCLLYDSENNIFYDIANNLFTCNLNRMGIKCINEIQECGVYCQKTSQTFSLLQYDKNFNIKEENINNNKCYSTFTIAGQNCYSIYTAYLFYSNNDNKLIVLNNCDEGLRVKDISETCSDNIEGTGLDCDNCDNSDNDSSSSIPTFKSTIISTIPTTIPTKVPTTILTTIPAKVPTTILTTIPDKVPTTILTTIPDKVPTTNIQTTIPDKVPTTILTTIADKVPTTILTTIPTKVPTTNIQTTFPTKVPTTILTTINSIKNIFSTNILLKTPSTLLSFSSSLFLPSTSSLIQSTKIIPLTSYLDINNSLLEYDNNNIIQFNSYEDIIKGTITINREELENRLEDIIKIIKIGKKYEINGEDYDLKITPINNQESFNSTFVDFTLCEQILRKVYNISSDEILTILQIEIDKKNEKVLSNQIEYAIYNENKKKLNLSHCKNVKIKVKYDISDKTLFNKSMISYYSELGIDILDSEDEFFNNLCYPFSISKSDVILKDRVLDIYQNYSLCDNGCEYEEIDLDNMSVACSCQIKTEINTEISPPVFSEIVQDTFKDSNFGVIRCYELVFNFTNKLHNIGFLLFLFFIIIHIICFILYFISGIKPIILFVYKEMENNNYLVRINNPKKSKKCSSQNLIDDSSNINNNGYNSSIINNIGKETSRKKVKNSNKTKIIERKIMKKKAKGSKHQPIFIFNYKYNNNYYKYHNKSYNSSKKTLDIPKNKSIYKKKKIVRFNVPKLNKEQNFPGYYNLIYINANNILKKKAPPESKYILNNYNYEEAIKYETRDFWRIYFICLLSKENILNTFFFKSPLEIKSLNLSLFIFTYSSDFAMNALFYFNDNISDKYHYEGDSLYYFIFVNNITISVFSTVFSYLLVKLLNVLTNSKYSIESLFREEERKMRKNKNYIVNKSTKKIIYNNLLKIYKYMKIKIICYIVIEFSIMIFFLYFITAFCEVYKDTQNSWLFDSFISFLLSILFELIISFLISILYILAMKTKIQFLYNLVMFLYKIG